MLRDRPLGGASMDPFRSLAPALLAGGKPLREVWIFIVGPFVGATLAALLTFMLGSRVHPLATLDATGTYPARIALVCRHSTTLTVGPLLDAGIGRAGPEDEEEQRIEQSAER
jgi:hypothetical protein